MQGPLEFIGRLLFSRDSIRKYEYKVNTAGMRVSAEAYVGTLVLVGLLLSILFAAILLSNPQSKYYIDKISGVISKSLPYPAVAGAVFLLSMIPSYLAVFVVSSAMMTIRADARRNALENALPDFLLLVSANIKAGMPLDQAMHYSAKPEYGLLSKEVQDTIKRSFSGESLEVALDELGKRFDSKLFTRTISLIKQSSATGGEVSAVLERTSQEVRNASIIKKEVSASLVLYEIFILFASVLGTPFLFAVSGKLIEVFEKTPAATSVPTGAVNTAFGQLSSMRFAGPIISSNEFFYFTLATIFVTSLFSSFIVGVIKSGSKNEGVKYFPFVLVASYVVYFIVNSFMNLLFTTIG